MAGWKRWPLRQSPLYLLTMLETGINIIEWPSFQYCTMSAFGGDALLRKAMSHKSSFYNNRLCQWGGNMNVILMWDIFCTIIIKFRCDNFFFFSLSFKAARVAVDYKILFHRFDNSDPQYSQEIHKVTFHPLSILYLFKPSTLSTSEMVANKKEALSNTVMSKAFLRVKANEKALQSLSLTLLYISSNWLRTKPRRFLYCLR